MSETTTFRPMANERAERNFVASGLPNELRPAVSQEAHWAMNNLNMRFSDAVHHACLSAKDGSWGSPLAASLAAEAWSA